MLMDFCMRSNRLKMCPLNKALRFHEVQLTGADSNCDALSSRTD